MTLFRTSDIIMVLLMLVTAFITYEVKYEAQRRYQEVRRLERKIESAQDSAAVLRARWALATEPARMERLAAQYHDGLGLEIIEPRQIVKLEDIPQRLPDAIEMAIKDSDALLAEKAAGAISASGLDPVATGSVGRKMPAKGDKAL